ncbi:hypothetical protein [Rugosimonospora africana]|uniref:Uncharacterized protein n=1 Tax=Rugosimonospora africana TaxID=556532 RepID=A0A8J3VRR7_9ACTN|nr:hypothetical protein [Rugosimonospora africana]GIH15673.1 hypothetical protein Raf01_38450 [Rugosimonospora africana]
MSEYRDLTDIDMCRTAADIGPGNATSCRTAKWGPAGVNLCRTAGTDVGGSVSACRNSAPDARNVNMCRNSEPVRICRTGVTVPGRDPLNASDEAALSGLLSPA